MPKLHRDFLNTVKAYRDVHNEDPFLTDPETLDRLSTLEARMSVFFERMDEPEPLTDEETDAA